MLRTTIVPSAVFVLALGASGPAHAQTCDGLGTASVFSMFLTGDLDQRWSDARGRVAVGGDATLRGVSVGDRLAPSPIRDDLVVGGRLEWTDGQLFSGNAVYGEPSSLTRIGFPVGTARQGPPSVDFDAIGAELVDLSDALASASVDGTTSVAPWGAIELRDRNTLEPAFVVFDVSAAAVDRAYSIDVFADAGDTVVINVRGENPSLRYMGIHLHGPLRQNVLWHFPEAETLELRGTGLLGTVFAPRAHVSFYWGQIQGSVVAESFEGTGESYLVPFSGCIPVAEDPCTGFEDDFYCGETLGIGAYYELRYCQDETTAAVQICEWGCEATRAECNDVGGGVARGSVGAP